MVPEVKEAPGEGFSRAGRGRASYKGGIWTGLAERRLKVPGRLDLEATLYSGQAFRWVRHEAGWHQGFIRNEPVLVQARPGGILAWRGHPRVGSEHVKHYFRLDESHDAFLAAAPSDPFLQTALARFPGLRLLRQDPWEILVSFIVSQNSNEAKIRRTIEAVCAAAGRPVPVEGSRLHRFPSPRRLAKMTEADLRATGMGYRAGYVRAAALGVARGSLRPATWIRRPYEDSFDELMGLHGVGEKVADCILLYGCDQLRAFPSDVWVRRFVQETYLPLPRRATYASIRDFAWRHFGADAGYAQHYLFHYRRRVGALAASPA
ncbi:MAG TPA: DNA glycosylase [Candidatus Thermoplasmatota archaeon]|nr:DNA glycosylase [Candidatus Thermoplasmatota archaeon]